MGPISIQNSSTKSDTRPSTRSTDAEVNNVCPSTAPPKSTSSNTQVEAPRSNAKNDTGKTSSVKRSRPPSPHKRSKARKSLNFDSEPVSPRKVARLSGEHVDSQFDLQHLPHLQLNQEQSEQETKNLGREESSYNGSNFLPSHLPQVPTDLMTSSSQHTRRSQRITLKKLEEGQSSLKSVEAGPGPSVNFNIPLGYPPPDTADQSSDYGTASERSYNHSQSQDATKSPPPPSVIEKRRRRLRGPDKQDKPLSSLNLSPRPGYLSDAEVGLSSDDDGYLDADTSHSQPWDDDADGYHPVSAIDQQNEWDRQIEQDNNSQHSLSSETSFLTIPPASFISAVVLSYRQTHILVPLEGYELPPASSGIATRSQSSLFCLDGTESGLYKRGGRLMPSKPSSPFSVEIFSNIFHQDSFLEEYGLRIVVASPVISLKPFGTKFAPTIPAIVSIPLDVDPMLDDEFYCLYSRTKPSTSGRPSSFDWRVLQDEDGNSKLHYEYGRVTVEVSEFCYLLIVIRNKYSDVELSKKISARNGGRLALPSKSHDLVQINFPKGCLDTDILARAKLFFDTELKLEDFFSKKPTLDSSKFALASPIVMIEPHGIRFNKIDGDIGTTNCVTIQLPIPDYDFIITNFSHLNPKLTLWQSCTNENEESKWEVLEKPYTVTKIQCGNVSQTVITFEVEHFSFFQAVWNIISSSLYEARVGMSYLYPYVSFSMKCQANMQENSEKRFGLEVICYRSDKVLPEFTTYPHRVGSCNKPKLVKPGRIIIRLKSRFFEQDEEAGEDEHGMVKEEADFRGRDFEMQYALKFKENATVGRGTFGKVIVKRHIRHGDEEPLFEFNLQKSGREGEQTPHDHSDRWSIVALQELAGNLFITADDNWKVFAKAIGFTNKEIKTLKPFPDPFIAILNLYQSRGGTPNEFVTALYSVNRQLKLCGGTSPAGSKKSVSSQGSSGLGSFGDRAESDSDSSGTQISQDSVLNGSIRKRSNPSIDRSKGSGSSKSKRTKHSKKSKKRKRSESTDESGESEEDDERSNASDGSADDEGVGAGEKAMSDTTSILHRRDMTKLESTYLWDLSIHMDSITWRNLARSLGLDEATIINIEHQNKSVGFRECAYQMLLCWKSKFPKRCTYGVLYQALCKEGMNAVAKKMKFVTRNDKD